MTIHKTGINNIEKSLGICLGASTISLVLLEWSEHGIIHGQRPDVRSWSLAHEGNPRQTLVSGLNAIGLGFCDHIAVTGRKFKNFLNLTTITEPEAVEYAYQFTCPENISCSAIVSAGGETFMVYVLDGAGNISNVITGNKCASGTGEFFLQQLKRMGVPLEEIENHVDETPFKVTGRCSVFCKSDCTHATNNGIPKARVTAGLCRMMADKVIELLKSVNKKNIMLTGGTVQNMRMLQYLKEDIDGLIIPKEAAFFEALGCALFAMDNKTLPFLGFKSLFKPKKSIFKTLPKLKDSENLVTFMSMKTAKIKKGEVCILGLDVGSTTTKAVLLRNFDNSLLESVYLRTNGDPVGASINCYKALLDQIKEKTDPETIRIKGIGICGSGRRIAGLHAFSNCVVNEITAHAFASVFFDSSVDTIFEIGGQDAKYTLITKGVPSDYAMNEACSAGTGSFLEESALETLGIEMEDIARLAFKGERPPNFNDQCAAFIGSDIKNAVQSGLGQEDILAGLVYSVCQNYLNRVKGSRPVGEKIFMQGGVCYNNAVPLAMASLLKKQIVVPPFPGLMGAFGVALAVKDRIEKKALLPGDFNLKTLIARKVKYLKPFKCSGRKGLCDRGCQISLIEIENKKIPFGGACDKYYNLHNPFVKKQEAENYVQLRQNLVFSEKKQKSIDTGDGKGLKSIGINRSFLVNTYYPFYSTFFISMGFNVEVPDEPDPRGTSRMEAPFCFPTELSHCFFYSMLKKKNKLDYIFMPHFKAIPDIGSQMHSQLCPFAQAEPYYLKTTFNKELSFFNKSVLNKTGTRILTPVLDMTNGIHDTEKIMIPIALKMGAKKKKAKQAFAKALQAQKDCFDKMKDLGENFLNSLENNPGKPGIVLFGRSYNSFVKEANKGIPGKFTSRGIPIVPFDCLPIEDEKEKQGLFWGTGQQIYKGAQFVKQHPGLFAVLITNFSCGPDSFIISYFRDVMGEKPSLTLELDSHTADAGLETRIEAFLDIILMTDQSKALPGKKVKPMVRARIFNEDNEMKFLTSSNSVIPLKHPDVEIVIPSMGRYGTESMAAVFRGLGFNARAHSPADEDILNLGRSNTLGKECLPMILTTGMLLNSVKRKEPDKKLAFFMATASGPCRLGQYEVYMKDLIQKQKLNDVAILSLSSGGSYAGLGNDFQKKIWIGTLISDAIEDIRSVIFANAKDVNRGLVILEHEWDRILKALESESIKHLISVITETAERLQDIPLKKPLDEVPVISLVGEIFVRRDSLSRRFLIQRLGKMGFAVACAPVTEWFLYIDLMLSKGFLKKKLSKFEMIEAMYRKKYMAKYEKIVQSIFKTSGLYNGHPVNIQTIIDCASPFIPMDLAGEAILTVGSSLMNIGSRACGVIALGPFGCMPNRISEAILNKTMNQNQKILTDPDNNELKSVLTNMDHLPFLAIESDGRPFPQIIEAKLETFLLRAIRLHGRMIEMDCTIENNIRTPLYCD